MSAIRNLVIFFGIWIAAMFLCLRLMGSMLVHDDAVISISKEACVTTIKAASVNGGGCLIDGSISNDFITGDKEITLKDNSVFVLKREYVNGYIVKGDASHYRPFGKLFAIFVGMLILVAGFIVSIFASGMKLPSKKGA